MGQREGRGEDETWGRTITPSFLALRWSERWWDSGVGRSVEVLRTHRAATASASFGCAFPSPLSGLYPMMVEKSLTSKQFYGIPNIVHLGGLAPPFLFLKLISSVQCSSCRA
jgi:hypothetical protein